MDYFDEDDGNKPAVKNWLEFDCPTCDANNPRDDGFAVGDEVICHYCGCGFDVKASSSKAPRLVEQ